MPPAIVSPTQPDLLDWTPPQAVGRFDERQVRAATLAQRISRAVAETLRAADAAGLTREDIASRMEEYLGPDTRVPLASVISK